MLFDIDGTLIDTGGAGARSWRWAFERLHGVPADIATSSSAGMTDPDVAIRTFEAVLGRAPSDHELARLFAWYVYRLQHEVEISEGYRVLGGVVENIEPGEVIVVGDTPLDVDAAKAVGAVSLGVASGKYSMDELRRAGADLVLASLDEPFPLTTDHDEA